MTAPALPSTVERRLRDLPKGLRDHVERSRMVGRELALVHGVDPDRVDQGVASHDLARGLNRESLLDEAHSAGLQPDAVEVENPVLLHGPLAAAWIESDGVDDTEVIEAVRWHSTGRSGMGPVAKVVFLADKLDPAKVRKYPALQEVATLAGDDVDGALLKYLDIQIDYLLSGGRMIHPASIELRNELLVATRTT